MSYVLLEETKINSNDDITPPPKKNSKKIYILTNNNRFIHVRFPIFTMSIFLQSVEHFLMKNIKVFYIDLY